MIFQRYEFKYMLSSAQRDAVLKAMQPYMALDQYGHKTVRNIYFDTDTYRLIRRSIEKPAYKEKLRIRSYKLASAASTVFVELKKKYESVVYKRRLSMAEGEAMAWLCGDKHCDLDTQISREIDYFRDYYGDLYPAVFLSYERDAYYAVDGGDLRITFDNNILCRQTDMSLESPAWGTPLLKGDRYLMEIKCSGGMPLWLTRVLSEQKLYKTSFSKYGTAYQMLIFPHKMMQEEQKHA